MEQMLTLRRFFARSEHGIWNIVPYSHHYWQLQNRKEQRVKPNDLGGSAGGRAFLNKLNMCVPSTEPPWNVKLGTWRQRHPKSLAKLKKRRHNSQHPHNLSLKKTHTGKLRINHSSQKVLNDRIWLQCLQFFTEMLHHVTFYCPVCMQMCTRLVLLLQMRRWTTALPKPESFKKIIDIMKSN